VPATLTPAMGRLAPAQWTLVRVHGHYVAGRSLRLDSQSHGDQPGFDVWTPLRTDDGALVMVDRGWLPHAQIAAPIPAPPDHPLEVSGLWRALPVPGIRLGDANCPAPAWPHTVEYPTLDDLRCLLGETPLPGLLLLSPQADGGFLRDWHPAPGFPPMRHYAYAVQWVALSLTLLVLGFRLLLKPST
jgi:surfeit locus 1 family protein